MLLIAALSVMCVIKGIHYKISSDGENSKLLEFVTLKAFISVFIRNISLFSFNCWMRLREAVTDF